MSKPSKAEPVAWIDDSGHPKHRLYRQSATEKRLYGPLRPAEEVAAELRRLPACLLMRTLQTIHEGPEGLFDSPSRPLVNPDQLGFSFRPTRTP